MSNASPTFVSDKDVVFGYFTLDQSEGGQGHICVALRRPPKGSRSGRYLAAAAFGSPLDTLNKKIGRVISYGRLVSNREGRNFSVRVTQGTDLQEVLLKAAAKSLNTRTKMIRGPRLVLQPYAPRWALEAVKEGFCLKPLFTKTVKPKAKKGVVKANKRKAV